MSQFRTTLCAETMYKNPTEWKRNVRVYEEIRDYLVARGCSYIFCKLTGTPGMIEVAYDPNNIKGADDERFLDELNMAFSGVHFSNLTTKERKVFCIGQQNERSRF